MKKTTIVLIFLLVLGFASKSQSRFIYADSLRVEDANPTPKRFIIANKIKQVTVERYSEYYNKTFEFQLFQTYEYDTLGNIAKVIRRSGKYATTMDSMIYDAVLKTRTMFSGYSSRGSIKLKSITHYINDTLNEEKIYRDSILIATGTTIFNYKKQLVVSQNTDLESFQTTSYRYIYNADGLPNQIQKKDSIGNFQDIYIYEYKFYKNKKETSIFWLGTGKKVISCKAIYNKQNQCIKHEQWLDSKLFSTIKFAYNNDGSLYQATEKSENIRDSTRLEILRFNYLKD